MSLTAGFGLGPYEIVAPLGAGGMGEVYRATDSHLKRAVANYSIGSDAGDFLMVEPEPGGRHLNLVMNWLSSVGGPR